MGLDDPLGRARVTTTTLQHQRYSTADADEACAFVSGQFAGAGVRIDGSRDADWRASLDVTLAEGFALSRMRLPAEVHYDVGYDGQVCITTVLDGRADIASRSGSSLHRRGDVFLSNCPDLDRVVQTHSIEIDVVMLPEATLRTALGAEHETALDWRPRGIDPTPEGLGLWRHVSRFVHDLVHDPDLPATPLVVAQAARLLAATTVNVFPGASDEPAPVRDAHPETLRRAVAFIEANPDLDIGVSEIALAARVTPRAVQLAFRRHLQTTPTAYLRRVRLDRVRADLLTADPARTTVTAVAARWGFASSSRFAAQYRAAYGEAPSVTLRR
jgi:AraC-like DNA-binding protein